MRRGKSRANEPKHGARRGASTAKKETRARAKPSAATLEEQLAAKTRELDEALQQQAATAEVLRAITGRSSTYRVFLNHTGERDAHLPSEFGLLGLFEADHFVNRASARLARRSRCGEFPHDNFIRTQKRSRLHAQNAPPPSYKDLRTSHRTLARSPDPALALAGLGSSQRPDGER